MNSVVYNGDKITPSKVVCVGRNYVEHIEELGNEIPENMVIFNKPNSAITNELNYYGEDCRFEGEISFLIVGGKIAGVGFGLDLTHAKTQNQLKTKGLPWERAKAFNGSAVFSEFISLDVPLDSLEMKLYRNDKLVQFANYELMIYKPLTIVEEIGLFMSFEDGDIVMTGTPKGVGTYQKGDRFVGEILSNGRILVEGSWEV